MFDMRIHTGSLDFRLYITQESLVRYGTTVTRESAGTLLEFLCLR